MYRSTPPELDHLRSSYTFSMDSLTYYELGMLLNPLNANPTEQARHSSTDMSQHPEILKLQRFCLYLLDRLNGQEATVVPSKRSRHRRRENAPASDSPQLPALPPPPPPRTSSPRRRSNAQL